MSLLLILNCQSWIAAPDSLKRPNAPVDRARVAEGIMKPVLSRSGRTVC
jgi:hypothetical protein